MWNCSDIEEGYLTGNLKELFIRCARKLFQEILDLDDYSTGTAYFDGMEKRERLFAIQYVTSRLVSPDGDMVGNRAWSDATIYSILWDGRGADSDLKDMCCRDYDLEDEDGEGDYSDLIFLILWDMDWDFSMAMDLHPVGYSLFTSIMGIDREYYIDSHPQVSGGVEDWQSVMEGLSDG